MFLGKEWKKEEDKFPDSYDDSSKLSNNLIFFGVIAFLVVVVLGIAFVLFLKPKKPEVVAVNPTPVASTTPDNNISRLPGDLGDGKKDEYYISSSTENIKIEDLTFGYFYEPVQDDFVMDIESYELPVNIKVDAANYHDLSRKLNIDEHIDHINQYGFAIFENQIKEEGNNFFSTYRGLLNENLPIVLTSDFIYYYYQNEMKQVFREIEKNTFFENVWNINKDMYDIALTRYKKRIAETGLVNDPVLEGERLELVYFAVALNLLMPMPGQINKNANFIDETKFSEQEAEIYNFLLPSYIIDDVEKEVALIRGSHNETKSPVFLYTKDYSYFKVPSDYNSNAKLNNFYLTLKWLNSVFPLYFQNEECPDCLLDYDDWVVNFTAASLIAKDIYDNQEIKNQWAIIYKFIAFFSGLRADLTYLHYNEALSELFGEDYNVENLFSASNINREQNLLDLRNRILENEFLPIEGGMRGYYDDHEMVLGLRILQEPFWPNDYLFKAMSGQDMGLKITDETQSNKDKIITSCKIGKSKFYRCTGYSMDLVDLLYPVELDDEVYRLNTQFYGFEDRMNSLLSTFNKFDIHTWNSNIYWVTLDISRKLFEYNRQTGPTFTQSDEWQKNKDINTMLGAWVNMHLSEDNFVNYYEKKNVTRLGAVSQCNKFNYIEPNLELMNELITRNDMLIKMLTVLKVVGNTNTAAIQLKELNNKLRQIILITKKQIEGKEMDDDECKFITELASNFAIENKKSDSFSVKVERKRLEEKLDGVKMLVVYYKYQDKNMLGVGPIFNYIERSGYVED